jgi:hypothetical protein
MIADFAEWLVRNPSPLVWRTAMCLHRERCWRLP